jgi:hypothetical protein
VKGDGGTGGNNLESSFSTLTAKVVSTERQTKYSRWTRNVRAKGGTASYIGQALRSTASRCQMCRNGGGPFLDCNLRFGNNRHMEGEGRGGEKKGTRSRALRGAMGFKNGVKSGRFWQPLSQDVALSRKVGCKGPLCRNPN